MSDKYVAGPDLDLDHEVVLDQRGRRITEERADGIAGDAIKRVAPDGGGARQEHL